MHKPLDAHAPLVSIQGIASDEDCAQSTSFSCRLRTGVRELPKKDQTVGGAQDVKSFENNNVPTEEYDRQRCILWVEIQIAAAEKKKGNSWPGAKSFDASTC